MTGKECENLFHRCAAKQWRTGLCARAAHGTGAPLLGYLLRPMSSDGGPNTWRNCDSLDIDSLKRQN